MEKEKIWEGIAIVLFISLLSTILHFSGVIKIMDILSNIYFWGATVALAIAINLIIRGFTKKHTDETSKKNIDDIQKDNNLYGINQGIVKNGIHHFNKQSELPPIERVLECAKQKIEILTWTAEKITTQHIDSIKRAINRNIEVTIMLLAPESNIAKQGDIVYNSIELPKRIENSLSILCELRNKLNNKKQNLKIKKYYVNNNNSMIILDSTSNNAWVQVTSYVKGVDASSRYSDASYKKENENFFNQHYSEFSFILKKSKEYKCK